MQISDGGSDPLAGPLPQLKLALTGIKRVQSRAAPDPRLPVTPTILRQLREAWSPFVHLWDVATLWAACCIGFFGFLCSGEFTLPCRATFDPRRHLSPADIAVDSVEAPTFVRLRLKESKADPFRNGVDVVIGRVEADICPVNALLAYLARHGMKMGPFSSLRIARRCRDRRSSTTLKQPYELVASPPIAIRATAFASAQRHRRRQRGIEDSTIRTLGRWRSDAYTRYIRMDPRDLASFSRRLAAT